jgi:DNA invertase Pin-like site-specific DNA recombinase
VAAADPSRYKALHGTSLERYSDGREREQLEAAMDYVREGDQFVCTKLDRLARSVGDLLTIVARLEAKSIPGLARAA